MTSAVKELAPLVEFDNALPDDLRRKVEKFTLGVAMMTALENVSLK